MPGLWLIACLTCSAFLVVTAETIHLDAYQKDIRQIEGTISQLRKEGMRTPEGIHRVMELETQLTKMKNFLWQMSDLASQLQTCDLQIRTIKDTELEPKEGNLENTIKNAKTRWDQYQAQDRAQHQEIMVHNAGKSSIDPTDDAAIQRYATEHDRLVARQKALIKEGERIKAQLEATVDQAIQAKTDAQKKYSEALVKQQKLGAQLSEAAKQYEETRVPFAQGLSTGSLPGGGVPLTAFANGVRPDQAGLQPVPDSERRLPLLPIGPGNNPHAIDQLRIVKASSEDAAIQASDELAKRESGYQFDTTAGLPVPLPKVATPTSGAGERTPPQDDKAQPVPLIMPASPAARKNAPEELKRNPVLQAIAKDTDDNIKVLEGLIRNRPNPGSKGLEANNKAINHAQGAMVQDAGIMVLSDLNLTAKPKSVPGVDGGSSKKLQPKDP